MLDIISVIVVVMMSIITVQDNIPVYATEVVRPLTASVAKCIPKLQTIATVVFLAFSVAPVIFTP